MKIEKKYLTALNEAKKNTKLVEAIYGIEIEKTPTIAKEIEELADLKKKGIITEEEFENKKAQLLNSDANTKEAE